MTNFLEDDHVNNVKEGHLGHFGTTWRWVNDIRIFISGWIILLIAYGLYPHAFSGYRL